MSKQTNDIAREDRLTQAGRIPYWLNKDLQALALDKERHKENLVQEAVIDLLIKYGRQPSKKGDLK